MNRRSIIVQTKRGRNIANTQFFQITLFDQSQFERFKREYTGVTWRTLPSAEYNCHGLTFASRRTGIDDVDELKKIIDDDGYKEILMKDVLPGDVALYYGELGDIEHSGIVIRAGEAPLNVPLIYSKWGSFLEGIHSVYNCPYSKTIKYFRMNYD